MTTEPTKLRYPFDPVGNQSTNLIAGEQNVLTTANFRDFHFIVPKFAPFFADSVKVSIRLLTGEVKLLEMGKDYYPTHLFISASRATANRVFGSLTFLDLTLAGVVTISYQTLGGDWVISDQAITELLASHLYNPRTTSWDTVANLPYQFPVIDHQWNLVDLIGAKEIVASLNNIETTIRNKIFTGLEAHEANVGNPHNVTAAQVGTYTKAEINALLRLAAANQLPVNLDSTTNTVPPLGY